MGGGHPDILQQETLPENTINKKATCQVQGAWFPEKEEVYAAGTGKGAGPKATASLVSHQSTTQPYFCLGSRAEQKG